MTIFLKKNQDFFSEYIERKEFPKKSQLDILCKSLKEILKESLETPKAIKGGFSEDIHEGISDLNGGTP